MKALQSLDHITYKHMLVSRPVAKAPKNPREGESGSCIIRDCCLELSPRNPTLARNIISSIIQSQSNLVILCSQYRVDVVFTLRH